MSFFVDLTPYSYRDLRLNKAYNVGWLDAAHSFSQGQVEQAVLDRLWDYCAILVSNSRGLINCPICNAHWNFTHNGETYTLGQAEILVPGRWGRTYHSPNLIFHYIRDHGYLPPQPFIQAVCRNANPLSQRHIKFLDKRGIPWCYQLDIDQAKIP